MSDEKGGCIEEILGKYRQRGYVIIENHEAVSILRKSRPIKNELVGVELPQTKCIATLRFWNGNNYWCLELYRQNNYLVKLTRGVAKEFNIRVETVYPN